MTKYGSDNPISVPSTLRSLVPGLMLNRVAHDIFTDIEDRLNDDSIVLIAGCGEGGSGTQSVSSDFLEDNVIGTDYQLTDFSDAVSDIHNLPFQDQSVDAVICQAVLEHVKDSSAAIGEMKRVLKPGGLIYIDVPFLQGYHALPMDFRRFTINGLRSEFDDYYEIRGGASVGPSSALFAILTQYLGYVFSMGRPEWEFVLSAGFRFPLFWMKYLDLVLLPLYGDDSTLLKVPGGVYWYGEKPES